MLNFFHLISPYYINDLIIKYDIKILIQRINIENKIYY
jgi:hypothetical protein